MRIVVDVSPLSHTPLGIGNYIRGSLSGLVEVAAGKHEIVAFAPTSLEGPSRIRSALAGTDGAPAELGGPYALTVATLEPRKNLGTLLEAHTHLVDELQLAVVGAQGWGEQPTLDRPGVRRLGYVTDNELARLYRGAAVVVYP